MNIKLKLCSLLAAGVMSLLTPPMSRAELLVNENFDYEVGDLVGQGGWIRNSQTGSNGLNLVQKPLTYAGYQSEAAGLAAFISYSDGEDCNQDKDAYKLLTDLAGAFKEGTVYASMLVNVAEVNASDVYSICFSQAIRDTGMEEGKSPTDYGKVFFKSGSSDGKFIIGASVNSGKADVDAVSGDLNLNETYLIVLGYEFIVGGRNDRLHIWVNPATNLETAPEATLSTAVAATGEFSTNLGMQCFQLRQGTTSSKHGPKVYVDALRIGTKWSELFADDGGGTTVETPTVVADPAAVDFGSLLQGATATKTLTVKGTNLTGDITLSCASSAVTIEPTTVSAADAMSEAGKEVTLTYVAGAQSLSSSLVLASEGADNVTVPLTAEVTPITDMMNIAALNAQPNETYAYLRYIGSMAKVSYVDAVQKIVYVQDMTGGMRLDYSSSYSETAPYEAGDKIKNFIVYRADNFGPQFTLVSAGTITSHGNEITPAEATFADIAADKESYAYKLVTVTDVTVTETGKTWGAGAAASQTINGTTTTGRVRTFAGTDLATTEIPAFITGLTGISTSASAVIITARSAADVASAPANLEVSQELKIDAAQYQEINKTVEYAVYNVKATALTSPVAISLTGTGAAMFSLNRTEIPAGTGIYPVTVSYTPTATGTHQARINFETTPAELNAGYSLKAKAYDPANPPVITVNTDGMTAFAALPGATHEQTISYTVANGLDYGTIKVGDGTGFRISSSSMMKEGTYNLTITFAPLTEGDYRQTITFSTPMADDVVVNVTGKCTGTVPPEENEGDEIAFEGPAMKQYTTDFTSATADNKPISLEGWKNVAYEGTRAWWSYTAEGNQMAKVVAYDSKATESTPCTMMLISPRLDFANATERLLCFNVMGKMMYNNMTEQLAVGVIDAATADPANVKWEAIDGLNLPCTAEENGEWARYVLDCDKWELPDEFYVVFVFSAMRGTESSVQYYVDDFSWGRTDMPFIRSSHQMLKINTEAGAAATSETVTIEGHNLTQPIALSLAGTDSKCFTLSTTELPAEGGTFTLDFISQEVREHTAIVTLLSGSDARADILVAAATDPSGIGSIAAESSVWGDTVSVYDLDGRVLLSEAPVADALELMRAERGRLFIVRTAAGTAYKYIAK